MRKNKWISLVITIIAVLLLGVCSVSKPVRSLEQRGTDVLYSKVQRKVNPNIKIITIDAKSEKEYGYFTSWDRSRAAELIQALNQPGYEPAVIAFDVNYVTEREPEGDAAFAKAAEEAGNVVTAARADTYHTVVDENGEWLEDALHVRGFEYPYNALKAVSAYGFSNATMDEDDVIRHALLSLECEGEKMYSFSYQTYLEYMDFLKLLCS